MKKDEKVTEKPINTDDIRSKILQTKDLKIEPIFIEEWDQQLYIRSMTGRERDVFLKGYLVEDPEDEGKVIQNNENYSAQVLVLTICADPEGKERVFKDGDVELLGEKSGKVISKLWLAAQKLSGLSTEEQGEQLKNSEGVQDKDSGLDNASNLDSQQ